MEERDFDDYDDVALGLVESIYDAVSNYPEWEDEDIYEHNPNLINNWQDYWTDVVARSIEKCVNNGELDIKESDDWKTIVNKVKNSPVSVQLSKARKDLVKDFETILFGEELDESHELDEMDRSGLEEFVGDVIEDIMHDTAKLAWPTKADEPDPGYDWRNHVDVRHWAEKWTERFIEDYEKNGTHRSKGEPVLSDRLFNHASQELLDILEYDVYPQHGIRR